MKILKYEDGGKSAETLRAVSTPIESFENGFGELFNEMFNALKETEAGVALACPQVGVNKRAFVMNTSDCPYMIIINPEIISKKGDMKYLEGCLSFPNQHIEKTRCKRVRLRFQDVKGNFHKKLFNKFDAIVVQHEIDHLDGILFID